MAVSSSSAQEANESTQSNSTDKAQSLFNLGKGGFAKAQQLPSGKAKKSVLVEAKQNVLDAARLQPKDREMRAVLEDIKSAIKEEASNSKRSLLGALYDDKEDVEESARAAAAATAAADAAAAAAAAQRCVRPPPDRCGKAFWVKQRAEWLRLPEELVAPEPASFEMQGSLLDARPAVTAAADSSHSAARASSPVESLDDMSSDERDQLEDCLDSVEKPYPLLKQQLSLRLAVHCAHRIWEDD